MWNSDGKKLRKVVSGACLSPLASRALCSKRETVACWARYCSRLPNLPDDSVSSSDTSCEMHVSELCVSGEETKAPLSSAVGVS